MLNVHFLIIFFQKSKDQKHGVSLPTGQLSAKLRNNTLLRRGVFSPVPPVPHHSLFCPMLRLLHTLQRL